MQDPAIRGPSRSDIGRRLAIALFVPALLLVGVGVVLAIQILQMRRTADWEAHSHEVISKAHQVRQEISTQEAAFRGFLLTADTEMLAPYAEANPLARITELAELVRDNSEQDARVETIRRRYEGWLAEVGPFANPAGIAKAIRPDRVRQRKEHMGAIIEALEEVLDAEDTLARARAEAAAESGDQTRVVFVLLLASAAAVITLLSRNQITGIMGLYETALTREAESREVLAQEQWLRSGQLGLAQRIQGDISIQQVGKRILDVLVPYVEADVGVFFAAEPGGFRRQAAHALDSERAVIETFAPAEGLLGRAVEAREIVRVRDVPPGALLLSSGTASTDPCEIVIVPAEVDGTVQAVLELGFLRPTADRVVQLLERVTETIAVATRSSEHRRRLRELLEESQRQSEELQTQQEELRVANEELSEHGKALREAQHQLEERQEALEGTNARLEEQAAALRRAESEVRQKAAEVERASQYKSEFLANMSHELRTPLNSTLILAKLLADNKEGNMTEEQVRYAETIYSAGNDLLSLVNEILDLSKVEAGKLEMRFAPVAVQQVCDAVTRIFEPLAYNKGLKLEVRIDPDAPDTLFTDAQRLEQVLRNLLSNAIKFTNAGAVRLTVEKRDDWVHFEVADTGIGIAPADQAAVFEAFRQLEGSADRKYAGTGLGLSISRQLAAFLGGSLRLRSEFGKGSVFTLALPCHLDHPGDGAAEVDRAWPVEPKARPPSDRPASDRPLQPPAFEDDRERLGDARRSALIVEDDVAFARILCELARELGFACLVAHDAATGIALAREYRPSAIILDVNLPDHTGLSVLDRLKRDSATRHIPIHVASVDDWEQAALNMGAIGYLRKPASREELVSVFEAFEAKLERKIQRLLIVEDDARQRESLQGLLGGEGVETTAVATVADALDALRRTTFDCVVTDLSLPDASGFELLERLAESNLSAFPPVVVYTGRSLSHDEEQRLRRYTSAIVVKGARSPERLLDEVTLFLHRVESELPPERQRVLKEARDREAVFDGRVILVVEDDVRNVFALSSILEPRGAKVLIARNGREALEVLEREDSVDLVLMDIMMPEMDGIAATKAIRKDGRWNKLPIIALTAKAMRDDQERCLQAGCNDYIPKPIDVDMLLSLLRVWMPR